MHFEDVPRGNAIFENPGASISHISSYNKSNLKGEEARIERLLRHKRRFFKDAPHGSVIFEHVRIQKRQKANVLVRERDF